MIKLPGYDIKETSWDKIKNHRTSSLFQCKVVKASPSPLCIAHSPISTSWRKALVPSRMRALSFPFKVRAPNSPLLRNPSSSLCLQVCFLSSPCLCADPRHLLRTLLGIPFPRKGISISFAETQRKEASDSQWIKYQGSPAGLGKRELLLTSTHSSSSSHWWRGVLCWLDCCPSSMYSMSPGGLLLNKG